VGLWVLDVPLVRLLFGHGEFDPRSTELVVFALHFYALGLISHAIVEISVRVFYALHDTWSPVLVGVAAMALNVLLSLLLVGALQHGGLALANSTATSLEMIVLLALLHRRMQGLELGKLGKSVLRNGIAAAVMALAVVMGVKWLQANPAVSGMASDWLVALGGIVLAVVTYGGVALLLGSNEARWLLGLVLRKRT
jgi:putative peptidoglycan lipid II flippase